MRHVHFTVPLPTKDLLEQGRVVAETTSGDVDVIDTRHVMPVCRAWVPLYLSGLYYWRRESVMSIRTYLQSLLHGTEEHPFDRTVLMFFALLLVPQLLEDLPRAFLCTLQHPLVQVILFSMMSFATSQVSSLDKIFYAVYDGVLFMAAFHALRALIHYLFDDESVADAEKGKAATGTVAELGRLGGVDGEKNPKKGVEESVDGADALAASTNSTL